MSLMRNLWRKRTRADQARHIWLVDEGAGPVGYLMVDLLDGSVHIDQVSVAPGSAGLGRMLIEHVAARAATGGFPALTLA
jgi:ribosomal protein S18 acetylase RimI-like enzyme